ncbi:hypothetical protein ABD87_14925 [Lysinibacillus sphaericus]|uniref:hypothetical protein n=1 Tax=Lysinibacillus sphaericus TaxID=1421 RepID=UPI0018CDE96C|nr:hypothetical protein [Lysinibacillus sphaericus]MBG9730787.1 hypothetical protein [Lysinibacillus sphaericus]
MQKAIPLKQRMSYFTCQCCQNNKAKIVSLHFEKYKGLDVVVCEKCHKHKAKFGRFPKKIQLDAGQLTTLSDKRTELATNLGFAIIPVFVVAIVVYIMFSYMNH